MRKNPRVCLQFSVFHDFGEYVYKGHHHDYRSVITKAEFPIRTKEDVPFLDVFSLEKDKIPFDISDIIKERKYRHKKQLYNFYFI